MPLKSKIKIPKKAPKTNFSTLPLELRLRIWKFSLPESRILLIKKTAHRNPENNEGFTVSRASYGGRHPSILHINHESREFALQHLTKKLGAYWNLAIDAPYFELHDIREHEQALIMTEFREDGLFKGFKHVVVDGLLWRWESASYTMEFKHMFGRNFTKMKTVIQNLNRLPGIETCTITHTDHTLQEDVVVKNKPWYLEEMSKENTLDPEFKTKAILDHIRKSMKDRSFSLSSSRDKLRDGVELSLMGIGGRKREVFPPGKPLRPPPLPANYYDWFS